jgi:hypothetical protein
VTAASISSGDKKASERKSDIGKHRGNPKIP